MHPSNPIVSTSPQLWGYRDFQPCPAVCKDSGDPNLGPYAVRFLFTELLLQPPHVLAAQEEDFLSFHEI